MIRKILLFLVLCSSAIMLVFSNITSSYALIPPNRPPRFAIDLIHGYDILYHNIRSQAVSLGYQIHEISDTAIQESDLDGTSIVLIFLPYVFTSIDYTQTEIDLLVNFVMNGGALYVVPMYCEWFSGTHHLRVATSVNVLYDYFGFRVSGEHYVMEYPTKVVESEHPIMEGVNKIKVEPDSGVPCPSVATLSKFDEPCESIYADEGYPLFLISSLGKGKVFVDLTDQGIGSQDIYDNRLVVRNAIIWLKGISTETYRIVVDDDFYDVHIKTNSTLSTFTFDNSSVKIDFYLTGLKGTAGFCNVTIPKSLMWCDNIEDWIVTVNNVVPSNLVKVEDDVNTHLYFVYDHSTLNIELIGQYVVPEFPLLLILPLFMVATLIVAIVHGRKRTGVR